MTEHVPAPAEHSPRKRTIQAHGDFVVEEVERCETAWVACSVGSVVEVRQ